MDSYYRQSQCPNHFPHSNDDRVVEMNSSSFVDRLHRRHVELEIDTVSIDSLFDSYLLIAVDVRTDREHSNLLY